MYPLPYVEPVFRPPSESQSLILQITIGCSYNQCTFCDMYTMEQKKFRVQSPEEIEHQIKQVAESGVYVERIFLGDGDAMSLSIRRLEQVLDWINHYLPQVQHISSYCLPRNLYKKSTEDLARLRSKGLVTMYIGCESGDDELLALVEKGETFETHREQVNKLSQAGMQTEAVIINGLGGTEFSEQHARNSAKLINAIQPAALWMLILGLPYGEQRFAKNFNGRFKPMNQQQLLVEMAQFIEGLELDNTLFRSDHASNYLPLHGQLGSDKGEMLRLIHAAIEGVIPLRDESQRAW